MRKSLLSTIALGVCVGLFLAADSRGQQGSELPVFGTTLQVQRPAGSPTAELVPAQISEDGHRVRNSLMRTVRDEFAPRHNFNVALFGNPAAAPTVISQLMDQLREADDDTVKADLTKQLEAAVVANFEEDMTSREAELTKLEERLAKLRAQLDRRRKAQEEIIQLQLKVMINEADGLGFSGASGFEPGLNSAASPAFGPVAVPSREIAR